MTGWMKNISPFWLGVLDAALNEGMSLCFAVFSASGEVVHANEGMKALLQITMNGERGVESLVNPDFGRLMKIPESDAAVFEGIFTIGNQLDVSRNIKGKAYRRDNQLLIIGEIDVSEMENLNRGMSVLNQEINNLQRELIKEKRTLEITLEELRETQAMLIHAEKMNALGQLVAGVAHEINNPISFVINNLHVLRNSFEEVLGAYQELEGLIKNEISPSLVQSAVRLRSEHDLDFITEDCDDLLKATLDGVLRVKKIVEDLRTFSRLDEAEIKEIDLMEGLKSTLSLVGPELTKRGIVVQIDAEALPPVSCYASQINQVFMNLIVNAAQAMNDGGLLKITAKCVDDQIHLDFADTGVGIPDGVKDKVFNPFFTTKPVGSGTGLGLSLAYKIITDNHLGTLTVDSAINEGSVFHVKIPRSI